MSVYQIHFSPTGGTKAVSELLASAWPETVSIDLCDPAADERTQSFTSDDLCIFAVPAFEGRVPPVNLRRIKRLTGNNTPCVMAAVYGNRAIDDTLIELEDELIPLGFKPFAAVSAVAEHSVLPMFGVGRPDDMDQAQLREFSRTIRSTYERGPVGVQVVVQGKGPYILINMYPIFHVLDSEKCTGGMLCAKLCPVSAIDLSNPGKLDAEVCMHCMRCVKICPTHAKHTPAERVEKTVEVIGHLLAGRKENTLYL